MFSVTTSTSGATSTGQASLVTNVSQTLNELIEFNHENYDITHGGYRINHMVHHLYSLASLGADSERLHRAMDEGKRILEPLKEPKITITEDNWEDHLGDFTNYSAYLKFFDAELKELGAKELFFKYTPALLPGSIGGAAHPLIHLGFATEFYDPIVLVEALALAASRHLALANAVDTPVHDDDGRGTLVLFNEVLREIANEPRFKLNVKAETGFLEKFEQLAANKDLVLDYFNKVTIDEDNASTRLMELFEASVDAYVAGAQHHRPDFFLVHGVTAAHATRVLFHQLPTADRVRLVRAQWLFLIVVYIAQGRPSLDNGPSHLRPYQQNYPWTRVVDEAIETGDQHVPKLVYAIHDVEKMFGERNGKWRAVAALTTANIHNHDEWEFYGHGHQEH